MTDKQKRIIDLCIEQLQGMKLSNDLNSPTVQLDMEQEWKDLGEELGMNLKDLDDSMFTVLLYIRDYE